MKILKPGKVEQRKFVCRNCGCVFAAHTGDAEFLTTKNSPYVFCPTCSFTQSWHDGEPYEEPTQDTGTVRERLLKLLTYLVLNSDSVNVIAEAEFILRNISNL